MSNVEESREAVAARLAEVRQAFDRDSRRAEKLRDAAVVGAAVVGVLLGLRGVKRLLGRGGRRSAKD